MDYTAENSVNTALENLFTIEKERKQIAARNQHSKQAVQSEKITERPNHSVGHAQQANLLAEKQRIDATLALRDQEAQKRIAALKAELNAVRWSREAIRNEIQWMSVRRSTDAVSNTKHRPWISIALVLSACGFALLLGWLFGRPERAPISSSTPPTPARMARDTSTSGDAPKSPSGTTAAAKDATATSSADGPTGTTETKRSVATEKVMHPRKTAPHRNRENRRIKKTQRGKRKPPTKQHELGFLDKCGSDPMCGFDNIR
jgi:hypothetical protein